MSHESIAPGIDPQDGTRRYWAFISYSHSDAEWGKLVFNALEGYRVPRALVGKPSLFGWPIPRRIFPVFLDVDELPSSPNLKDNIAESLAQSHTLLVICSPHAAASHWVNEEVRRYKAMGREGRILALIVDGEPHALSQPDSGRAECFPPALRVAADATGALTSEPAEPLAADVRPRSGMNWSLARLKLIAGVLGVPLDALRQRERERARRRRVVGVALALLLLAAFGALRWKTQQEERLAHGRELVAQAGHHLANRHFLHAGLALEGAVKAGIPPAQVVDLFQRVSIALVDQVDLLPSDSRRIESLAYSADSHLLCAAGDDGRAWLWDTSKSPALLYGRQRLGRRSVAGVAFHPGQPIVAAALWDGNLAVWNYEAAEPLRTLAGHVRKIRVNALSFHPQGTALVSCGDDTMVKAWSTADWTLSGGDLAEHDDFAKSVRYSPDGSLVVTAGFDGRVKVIQFADRKVIADLKFRDKFNRALVTPDDQAIICAGLSGTVRIVAIPSGRVLRTMDRAHGSRINDLALHPDGQSFLTASDDGYVRRWLIRDGSLIQAIETHGEFRRDPESRATNILSIAVSPDGRRLATGGDDGQIKLWNLETGRGTRDPVAILAAIRQRIPAEP